jgi:hypothetical protein
MTPRGTTLYPFVPSGPQFVRSVAFLQELGVTKVWESAGLAGHCASMERISSCRTSCTRVADQPNDHIRSR